MLVKSRNYPPAWNSFGIPFFAVAALLSGCTLPLGTANSNGGLSIYPPSTSVGVGQEMTFQVSGGIPPYQFQVSGDGSVDTSGDFQAGMYGGTAQVAVVDGYGHSGIATISVVQSTSYSSSYTPPDNSGTDLPNYGDSEGSNFAQDSALKKLGLDPTHGWTMATDKASLPRGQVVAVGDQTREDGKVFHSRFIDTNLPHPVVRVDEEMKDGHVEAVRAVIEDQFIARLRPGYSESDLAAVLRKSGARISGRMGHDTQKSYLVSLYRPGDRRGEPSGLTVSADFMAKRETLKHDLQAIAVVSPNVVSARAPARQ